MPKNPQNTIEARRDKVWGLMLRGYNAQQIRGILNLTNPTVYRDIEFLTKKSKQYVYDMARGTHVLFFQRAIEGIGLTQSEAWNKFHDPKVPEKQKAYYLRLTKDCQESILNVAVNGPTVMGIIDLRRRIERFGIDTNRPVELSEQEQVRNYISSRYNESRFADGVNLVTSMNEEESGKEDDRMKMKNGFKDTGRLH